MVGRSGKGGKGTSIKECEATKEKPRNYIGNEKGDRKTYMSDLNQTAEIFSAVWFMLSSDMRKKSDGRSIRKLYAGSDKKKAVVEAKDDFFSKRKTSRGAARFYKI